MALHVVLNDHLGRLYMILGVCGLQVMFYLSGPCGGSLNIHLDCHIRLEITQPGKGVILVP
jgi:hypothetical protein